MLNTRKVPPESNQIYIPSHDKTGDWKHFDDSKLCDKSVNFSGNLPNIIARRKKGDRKVNDAYGAKGRRKKILIKIPLRVIIRT